MTHLPKNLGFLTQRSRSEQIIYLIDKIGNHPNELHKKQIMSFLKSLRKSSHHIYVLLKNLPPDKFRIIRYLEYRTAKNNWDYTDNPDIYTVSKFLDKDSKFHMRDEFCLCFWGDHFYFDLELSVERFIPYYERFLQFHCEYGLRNNMPIVLTPEIITAYGLTDSDRTIIGDLLECFSDDAVLKIQAEYDELKSLDCIRL